MPTHRRSLERVDALSARLGPGPWSLTAVRAEGWTTTQIRRAVEQGRLVRPRRGALDVPGTADPPGPSAGIGAAGSLLVLRARCALLLERYVGAVVSHETAGLLHGLWLPRSPGREVHLISPRPPDRAELGVRVHGSRLPRSQIVVLDGLSLTSLTRTAVDLARGRSIEDAVVALDSAARAIVRNAGIDLRRLRDDRELRAWWTEEAQRQLWQAYRSVRRWPFTVVVRSAIPLIDPASESPFESRSRIRIAATELPVPAVAASVRGASGTWYFVDFLWHEWKVIGEADGTSKYGEDSATVRARVRAERRRQRDLEDAGWVFARWETTEPATVVVQRLRRTLHARGWNPGLTRPSAQQRRPGEHLAE